MSLSESDFDAYVFSKQPDYDEKTVRREFAKAVPLRTVDIYCYDPRAVGIPAAVAKAFSDVFPGEVVAGGRAIDALRSVTVAQYLFGIENIVIVHHTYCGATSFTAGGIIDAYERELGTDIANLFERDSICITDYATSLRHDVRLMRASAGTPRHASIYGCLYNMDTEELSLVIEDKGVMTRRMGKRRRSSVAMRAFRVGPARARTARARKGDSDGVRER